MKYQLALVNAIAAGLMAASGSAAAAGEAPLGQLAWLGGCWNADGSEPGSGEHWMPLAGASLMGVSRTVRQGRTVDYEFMRIAENADGKLAFFAQPSGKPPESFSVKSMSATEVVFENLAHDFPQRVIYRLEAPAKLRASIEGMRNGALKSIEFPMARVSCDSQFVPAAK